MTSDTMPLPQQELASATRGDPAEPTTTHGQADVEAFGELGPVLACTFLLWLVIVAAVAVAV
jgi:hypothetical protein